MSNDECIAGLDTVTAAVAADFIAAHPSAILTSGRRSLLAQCAAMASNVMRDRLWIGKTYAPGKASGAAQAWVSANPGAVTVLLVTNGLYGVLRHFSPEDLRHLSWHLNGQAFDVLPVADTGPEATLRGLVQARIGVGGSGKVLTQEGGIRKLHCQVA